MFVNRMVVSPFLALEMIIKTLVLSSREYQISFTSVSGRSLPCESMGHIVVVRLPCAMTPSIIRSPKSSFLKSGLGGGGPGGATCFGAEDRCGGGCMAIR